MRRGEFAVVLCVSVVAAMAAIGGTAHGGGALTAAHQRAATGVGKHDRFYLALRALMPRFAAGMEAHVGTLQDMLAAEGRLNNPVLISRLRRTRALFAELGSGFGALPANDQPTRVIARDLARFAALYAAAYADYIEGARRNSFTPLDRGDAKIGQAARLIVSVSPRVRALDVSVPRNQPPRALARYSRSLALLTPPLNEAEAQAAACLDHFIAGDAAATVRCGRPVLSRYRRLLERIVALRPESASDELAAISNDVERAYRLIVNGFARFIRALDHGAQAQVERGIKQLQDGQRLRYALASRLLALALRYI